MISWVIATTLFLDQLTKYLAMHYLVGRTEAIPLIPGFISLYYRPNTGAAYGMMEGQPFALSLVTLAAIILIGWIAWKTPRDHHWARWGYSLILGGAAGNLVDRLIRGAAPLQGHVVDFMEFKFPSIFARFSFVNNLADDAISIGFVCVLIAFFIYPQTTAAPTGHGETEPSPASD